MSLEWSAEVGQRPHRKQVDAQERLDTGDDTDPAGGPQRILVGLKSGNPGADVELAEANVKSYAGNWVMTR